MPIIEILFSLHQLGFVHGDIRLANMLFAERVSESRIIDWDYGGKEGEAFYPPGYACALVDGPRHPEIIKSVASGTLQVKKIHDLFALSSVMRLFQPREENERLWASAIAKVHGGQKPETSLNFSLRAPAAVKDAFSQARPKTSTVRRQKL